MRTAQFIVLATVLALLIATRAASATPSAQTAAPTPVALPTSPVPPVATVVSVSSSPPVTAPASNGTLPVGQAPLSLAQRVSSESVMPGSEVRYTIQIASARAGATIETQSLLPAELRLIGASISGGNCNGSAAVTCWTTLGQSGGATIEIVAQVLPGAAVGSTIVSQTLVQDDLSYTAASDQTTITVIAGPAVQNSQSKAAPAAKPAKPAPVAQPVQPRAAPSAPEIGSGAIDRGVGVAPAAELEGIPAWPAADPAPMLPDERTAPVPANQADPRGLVEPGLASVEGQPSDAAQPSMPDPAPQNALPAVSGPNERRVVP